MDDTIGMIVIGYKLDVYKIVWWIEKQTMRLGPGQMFCVVIQSFAMILGKECNTLVPYWEDRVVVHIVCSL